MFISDKPIICPEDDVLNRTQFSENLAKTIIEWDQTDCIVFAVNARWGYGKTSLLNLVKHYICLKTKEPSNVLSKLVKKFIKPKIDGVSKRIVTVDYYPWGFDDQDRIHSALFKDISKAINKNGFYFHKVATRICEYSRALRNKQYLPFDIFAKGILLLATLVGGFIYKGNHNIYFWLAFALFAVLFIISLISIITSSRSPIEVKRKLAKMIIRKKLRLVVFIDDIDRLSKDEILSLLKIIRVNADFPNCIYVLALDYEVVSNIIGSHEFGISGYDYLNKIIQINLSLPAHDPELIRKYIVNDLSSYCDSQNMLALTKQFVDGAKHWHSIQEAGLWSMICSLREAKRFLNVVKYLFSILWNNSTMEVNTLDLLSIEALRLYDPSSYEYVKSNEELFCNTQRGLFENKEDAVKRHTELYKKWVSTINEDKKSPVLKLLQVLFPQLKNYEPNVFGYIDYDESDDIRNLRINTKEHFAKYFSFDFERTGDCVTQQDIEILVNSQDYDKLKDILRKHIETNSLAQLLRRLSNEISAEVLESKSFEALLQVLFDVSDTVSYDYNRVFAGQDYDTLYYSALSIIERMEDTEADRVIPMLIKRSESLYLSVRVMKTILDSNKNIQFYQTIVSDSIIGKAKINVLNLIEDRRESLLEHPQFSFIYNCWHEWSSDKNIVTRYRNELYQNHSKLMILMDRIQNKVYSSNKVEPIRYFDLVTLSSTHDIELMHTKIKDLMNQHEELYYANKIMVDRFLSNYVDFKQGKKVDWSNIKE